MATLLDIIRTRKSVRTFDGKALSPAERDDIMAYANAIEPPFGVNIRFVWMDAGEKGLSSPVIGGEKAYIAGIVAPSPGWEEAYGYAFEQLVLYAWQKGIGTVWIGGTFDRSKFEQACGLGDNEKMPCATPVGRPARKRGIKESFMRMGISADDRKPGSELFFDGGFDKSLIVEDEILADAFEAVRWAPSAVNKQPWRVVKVGNAFHFYEQQGSKRYVSDATGDLQRIDVGIALCHFATALTYHGKTPALTREDPGLNAPEGATYVATITI